MYNPIVAIYVHTHYCKINWAIFFNGGNLILVSRECLCYIVKYIAEFSYLEVLMIADGYIKDSINLRKKTLVVCQQFSNVYPVNVFCYMMSVPVDVMRHRHTWNLLRGATKQQHITEAGVVWGYIS